MSRPTPERLAEMRSGTACDFFEVQDMLDDALTEIDALKAEIADLEQLAASGRAFRERHQT